MFALEHQIWLCVLCREHLAALFLVQHFSADREGPKKRFRQKNDYTVAGVGWEERETKGRGTHNSKRPVRLTASLRMVWKEVCSH